MKSETIRSISYLILIFILMKILFLAVMFSFPNVRPDYYMVGYIFNNQDTFLERLALYDGQWYLHIAAEGYSQGSNLMLDHGFYPMYPFTIWILSIFGLNIVVAGLVISWVAGALAVVLLYILIKDGFGNAVAKKSVTYLLIFPGAFFLSVLYTEALFLMFVALSFIYAQKEKWALAGIFGAFVTLTRIQGIFLVFPLAYMYYRNRGFLLKKTDKKVFYIALLPVSLVLFYLYLFSLTGDFFASYNDQAEGWGKGPRIPLLPTILKYIENPQFHTYSYSIIDLSFGIFFLVLLVLMYKRLPREYFIYSLFAWTVPLIGGGTESLTRYLLLSFPSFILLGQWGEKNKIVNWTIIIVFTILSAYFAYLFTRGHWAG
ncbi:glycosyltransferase family 39 protein [Candidatus Pacearchaeota archaeon]|nr:glycosyltransferase family 39 protein [Candidatus Pacearchaeota archaeon]